MTMGDPAGIGPEIIEKAIRNQSLRNKFQIIILGDQRHLRRLPRSLVVPRKDIFNASELLKNKHSLILVDFQNAPLTSSDIGQPTAIYGKASGEYIEAGIDLAMKNHVDAVVTCPINKISFRMGGWGRKYTGHTEMFAALTRTPDVVLMMVYGHFRAVHVTSHIPLKDVVRFITKEKIIQTLKLTQNGLKWLGLTNPPIGVAGLNPHAGDEGILGIEEKTIIGPAIANARARRINVFGPYPADSLWPKVLAGHFAAGVAMYHDQGQIPIKLLGLKFMRNGLTVAGGVNITLGLPIIRTSVAHGTAYEIAGKGMASPESLKEAMELAATMVNNKRKKN